MWERRPRVGKNVETRYISGGSAFPVAWSGVVDPNCAARIGSQFLLHNHDYGIAIFGIAIGPAMAKYRLIESGEQGRTNPGARTSVTARRRRGTIQAHSAPFSGNPARPAKFPSINAAACTPPPESLSPTALHRFSNSVAFVIRAAVPHCPSPLLGSVPRHPSRTHRSPGRSDYARRSARPSRGVKRLPAHDLRVAAECSTVAVLVTPSPLHEGLRRQPY